MADVKCGTVYDWKKAELSAAEPLEEYEVQKQIVNIGAWFSSTLDKDYYMLLNNKINDYTIFEFIHQNYSKAIEELREVVESRGIIMDIDFDHDNRIFEFWVKRHDTGEIMEYLLFPCDDFIVKI